VHLVDISCKAQPPRLLAALAAHSAPVLGVAWSEDESRLASCDKRGVVVVWEAVAPAPARQQ
jgi:WD40 repeat protein